MTTKVIGPSEEGIAIVFLSGHNMMVKLHCILHNYIYVYNRLVCFPKLYLEKFFWQWAVVPAKIHNGSKY